MVNPFQDLVSLMARTPALPGARCREHPELFDEPDPDEDPDATELRHLAALAMCRGCPVLKECRQWVGSLPFRRRPRGVVAGRVRG